MKISVCLLLSIFAVAVYSLPANKINRIKRGFRNGAADRFSHGFGKRGQLFGETNQIENSDTVMTSEGLVDFMRNNPSLLSLFVEEYIDTNGDGQISRDELFSQKLE